MAEAPELDLSDLGKFTPESVRDSYRSIVPRVMAGNPDLHAPQEAFSHIRTSEKLHNARLFGTTLSEEATPLQASVFNRRYLRLKRGLRIATDEEREQLAGIDATFTDAAAKLASLRGISLEEADSILMGVFNWRALQGPEEAVELLTHGPRIEGFGGEEPSGFDFSNEDLRAMLEGSFGREEILNSRLLSITKVGGFPVKCTDISFGNDCIEKYNAEWEGGFLVLPDRTTYEEVAMQLEGVADPKELQHLFKLRASADASGGFATVRVREFVVEQPSNFDYLDGLSFSEQDKMRAYFLGIIAHETVHAMQAFGIAKEIQERYSTIALEERGESVGHTFVTQYVDRHHTIYNSGKRETLKEDLAEAIRVYLTNADYLKEHFPRRYTFLQEQLPFVQENAIQHFVAGHRTPAENPTQALS